MIENEKQYKITRTKIAKLEAALKQSIESSQNLNPTLREAVIAGIRSQIDDLIAEMREYEELKAKKIEYLCMRSLAYFGDILIKARIARGYTQAELAERLNLQAQQIQKYETTRYESASFRRLLDVMFSLGIDVRARIDIRQGKQSRGVADNENTSSTLKGPSPRSHFVTDPVCLKRVGINVEKTRERAQELRAFV